MHDDLSAHPFFGVDRAAVLERAGVAEAHGVAAFFLRVRVEAVEGDVVFGFFLPYPLDAVAAAILTTDTVSKTAYAEIKSGRKIARIAGM